jgi:hypothetical protein
MVELARVRWASPAEFGLHFRIFRHDAKKRLLRFLSVANAA